MYMFMHVHVECCGTCIPFTSKMPKLVPRVKTVKTSYLSVRYHLWQGRVHCCLATDEPCPGQTPFAKVSPGDVVKARVVCVREKEIRG